MSRPRKDEHNIPTDEGNADDDSDESDANGSTDELPSTSKPKSKRSQVRCPKGFSLPKTTQKVLHSVHSFFMKERAQGKPLTSFTAVLARTTMATGLCANTVRKYIRAGIVDTPGKKRLNGKKKFGLVDNYILSWVRRTIFDFYSKGIAPTSEQLLQSMQQFTKGTCYEFPYKISTFREMVREIGFKSKQTKIQPILIENPRIEQWRFRYLNQIETYRKEKRNIVFIDETWFNVEDKSGEAESDSTELSLMRSRTSGKGQRITFLHAGSENGWIPGSQLIVHTKALWSPDDNKDTDSYNFEKWFEEQLLPVLPSGSGIVVDNASHHSRKTNETPKNSWTKDNIEEWLDANEIPHPPKECVMKQTLLDIARASGIKANNVVEDLAKSRGCEVLRLPPYHCQFNPVEMALAKVKSILRSRHNSTESPETIVLLCMEAFNEVTPDDWKEFVANVKKEEQLFKRGQIRYENEFQGLVTNLQGSESSDESMDED